MTRSAQNPDGPFYVGSRRDLCRLLGLGDTAIKRRLRAGWPAKGLKGYDATAWVARHVETRPVTRPGDSSASEADRRWKLARAEREERKNALEAGDVVSARDAQERRSEWLRWVVSVFDGAGAELAGKIQGKRPAEARKVVTEYFDRKRDEATVRA